MKRFNLLTAVSVFLVSCIGNSFSQSRPNILWITIEDTSPQFIGAYGNRSASTPNIDKLCETGVRFTNAFSTGTVCSPSRSAIITGVKTFETGMGNHRSEVQLPANMHGFPYYLQQLGYYTSNNHKTDYNVVNERTFIKDAWNENSQNAGWSKRKPGQPFFAVFNFTDSHQSRTMTNPYETYKKMVLDQLSPEERIGENAFELPPFYHDTPEMRKQFARVYNSLKLTDNKIGALLTRLHEDKLIDSTIIFFYGDHGEGIPRGKTNGINLGYRVPMAIWFPKMYKHLSPWGSGLVSDELIDFADLAPTLISIAGGKVPGYMKGRVLMGPGRSKPADHLELSSDRSDNGIDVVRTITDGRFLYSRNYMPFMPEARYINYMEISEIKQLMRKDLAEGKLNALQKSIFAPRPAEFLFDTEQDIWETKNLAADPRYKEKLTSMRKELEESVIRSRDVMFLPEYELMQVSATEPPYDYRVNEKDYPIKEIYAIASLSGMRGSSIAQKQVQALASKNKIVRYWAALGLRSQARETLVPFKKQILNAITDVFPPAAITASAIAYDVFNDKAAEANMKRFVSSQNKELALLAMNYLLYVEHPEPFVATVKAVKADAGTGPNVVWAADDFLNSLKYR